jgi:putative membrane protein
MKVLSILAAVAGLGGMAGLVLYFGFDAVLASLQAMGVAGFAAMCAIHLVLVVFMGLAWWVLLPGTRPLRVIWGRLVRDSGSEVLPLSQVGGYVLGARAVALAGVSGTVAAASTIVDVTLEFIAQLAYTALGLAWLAQLRPDSAVALPITIGLGVASVTAVLLLAVQRRGIGYIDRIAERLGEGWAERTASGAAALHNALGAIYRNRSGLWWSFALHLGCWIASAAEAWAALRLAGVSIGFDAVLVVECLMYAIRTVAFLVPNAVGVQEGAYILLGASFGLTPEMALALSLLKRARDLTLGLPAIASWQWLEGGRLWRRLERRRPALETPAAAIPVAIPERMRAGSDG